MSIERQNILDVIGRNQSKYASCIITCFSFDFTFFEQRVMSVLKTANVRNIHVFVDDKFLDNALEQNEGGEFQTHKTYSITGIRAKGVFHPKIMFLAGPKHGLLIIGSGNLTNSGLSSNDEVWGAFHLNGIESQNAPLFAKVWNYLEDFNRQSDGINAEKLTWVKQRAPWIDEISSADFPQETEVNNETTIRFLANYKESSLYNQVISALPRKSLKELNIVSPYFDEQGRFLSEIMEDLKPETVNCITDPQFGILPHELEDHLKEKINFYAWADCLTDATGISRLHAKLVQFKFTDGSEYLLFGSANATIQAFGGKGISAANEEACLLINNTKNPDYLTDLGISLSNAIPLTIERQEKKKNNAGDSIQSIKIAHRIKHAEIKDNRLTIFFDQIKETTGILNVLDNWGKMVLTDPITTDVQQSFVIDQSLCPNRVFILEGTTRVSNYALIHDVSIQEKSNPDPKQAEINELIENLENNPDGGFYISLLKHADFNWVDHELEKSTGPNFSNRTSKELETTKEYQSIDQDKFYALSSVQQSQAALLKENGVRISDVLSIISKGRLKTIEDVSESEEERQASEAIDDQTGEGDVVTSGKRIRHDGNEERRVIHSFIKRTQDFYKSQLNEFLTKKHLNDSPARKFQLKDYANISISLDLINIFSNRNFETERTVVALFFDKALHKDIERLEYQLSMERLNRTHSDYPNLVYYHLESTKIKDFIIAAQKIDGLRLLAQDEYETVKEQHRYFYTGSAYDPYGKGILSYLTNLLGSFLIVSNSGPTEYAYHLVNNKVNLYRKEILERSIFLILNNRWKDSEEKYRDILILDLLHFISDEAWRTQMDEEIKLLFENAYSKTKYPSDYFQSNLSRMFALLHSYNKWHAIFQNDRTVLSKSKSNVGYGQIAFSSKIGFFSVKMVKTDSLVIVKPGLNWDEMHQEFTLQLNYPQDKILTF
jgi:hypothetical protein